MGTENVLTAAAAGISILLLWLFVAVAVAIAESKTYHPAEREPEREKGPEIGKAAKNVFYVVLGLVFWAGLGVFLYTTFIKDWGSTSGGPGPDDVGCSRSGDCY